MLSPMPSSLQHHHPHANGLLATPPTPTLVTAPPLFTGPTSATGGAFTGFCIPTTTLAAASSLFAAAAAHQHQQPNAFEGVPIFLVPSSQHNNNHAGSLAALAALKAAVREMKVNWATQPGMTQKIDTSKHFHVFVGDLSPEVDNKALRDAFAPFGDVSDAKVIRDLQTLKSKGYGFVSFIKKEEAERAIEQMNGQWLGRRTIRTNWATRKPQGGGFYTGNEQSYDEVFSMTSVGNATVYIGGINPNTSEEDMRKAFSKYGTILEIRIFKQQGYSFVRFDSKESATNAICNMNGTEVNGATVRCSWGRAGQDGSGGMGAQPYSSGYGGGYSNAYSQGYGSGAGTNAQQSSSTAAQQQYWTNYYQQFYNNPQMMQQWQSYWQQQQGGQ